MVAGRRERRERDRRGVRIEGVGVESLFLRKGNGRMWDIESWRKDGEDIDFKI